MVASPRAVHSQVLFSSVAALLGSPGQAGYAAANGALDAVAAAWRRSGMLVTSVQWGGWAGAGMAASHITQARTPLRDQRA